jgi:hypothetical protein
MLHLYLETYKITYKVKVLLAKIGSKMQPKVVVLLPFIATFENIVCRYPRMNIRVSKA